MPYANTGDVARRIALLAGALGLLGGLAACGSDSNTPSVPTPAPVAPAPAPTPEPEPDHEEETATYEIEYVAHITSSPVLQALFGAEPFPEGVGTAPPAALIAHPRDAAPWMMGGMASDGLKTLAETGNADAFIQEAMDAGHEVLLMSQDELTALVSGPEEERVVTLHHDRPCVTFAQMIAPSPDWFIGFSNVCAVDEEGHWMEEVTLTSVAFDAGTASGEEFALKAEGADLMPRQAIDYLDMAPFSPAGTPVATITGHHHHDDDH